MLRNSALGAGPKVPTPQIERAAGLHMLLGSSSCRARSSEKRATIGYTARRQFAKLGSGQGVRGGSLWKLQDCDEPLQWTHPTLRPLGRPQKPPAGCGSLRDPAVCFCGTHSSFCLCCRKRRYVASATHASETRQSARSQAKPLTFGIF